MTVYKLSLKVMKSNLGPMTLFLGIFIGISLLAASSGGNTAEQLFTRSRVPIAFIAEE